jgi:CheY-like chemotaxis protein
MSSSKKRVLLVEDDGTLSALYTDLLESEGYKVEHAVEGKEGLQKAKEGGYDLILLDILLPGLQGTEILKHLHQKPPIQPNGPIVVLTNQDQEDILQKCRKLGAAGEIIKSNVTQDQFMQRILEYTTDKDNKKT